MEERAARLRRRAAALRRELADAAERGDGWSVAAYTVDLEDLQRLGRQDDIDLAEGAARGG